MFVRALSMPLGWPIFLVSLLLGWLLTPLPVRAGNVTLKNGMQIEGRIGPIAKIGQNPFAAVTNPGQVQGIKQIVLVDDDLRRIFVSSLQVAALKETPPKPEEKFKIFQRVAGGKQHVGQVVGIVGIEPFDCYGRRTFALNTASGRLDIVQGITEITPDVTKVEGLIGTKYVWDMRIATSSIPRDTLSCVVRQRMDENNADDRLRIVRLYLEAKRFKDAQVELLSVMKDFPDLGELEKQARSLRQLAANRMIDEIELRRAAGQFRLAYGMAQAFPKDVAGETLFRVGKVIDDLDEETKRIKHVIELFDTHVKGLKDESLRMRVAPMRAEIAADLNINTANRMADYLRLADDEKMAADQKLSLAMSGWLLGSGEGTENLAVSLSLFEVRNLVRQYLRSSRPAERDELLERITSLEGGTPGYLSKIIAQMKPPIETEAAEEKTPGLFELTTPGLIGEPDITYHVQLPPEYDPYRRYPCVVTLNGAGTTPLHQIDWWAGVHSERTGIRMGQAARRGYIVVAPKWSREHQTKYEYSAREHAAVLYSLRDAFRRFSIDTDRVFLSGHSMGGDATWDIALAHPDVWAGAMPIVAVADRYVNHYWENARNVPLYFVCGDMDGNKMDRNGRDFDRYLTKNNYDVMIVEYQGRGHEHFHDEIQHLFTWMELHKRDFFPKEFEAVTMRPWDNYFWWAEVDDLPEISMVSPVAWPPQRFRPAQIEGRILETNGVYLKTAGRKATVWLSPEMVDFETRVTVNSSISKSRSKSQLVKPSSRTLLEDVRTRADRQHPFWAKVEL